MFRMCKMLYSPDDSLIVRFVEYRFCYFFFLCETYRLESLAAGFESPFSWSLSCPVNSAIVNSICNSKVASRPSRTTVGMWT